MAFLNIAPTGTVLPFVGINAPEGWLLCDGTPKLRTTYADLFSRISIPITVSSTNGSTTLNTGAVNPATLGIAAGMPISGTGIQAGTTVSSTTATTIVLSLAATATNASIVVTVCPYGVGDGSTTFNLPDLRGVYPRGSGTNGTSNYGGATGHTPAGGALANKGRQRTAANNLANAASALSTTVGNTDLSHGHTINSPYGRLWNDYGSAGGTTARKVPPSVGNYINASNEFYVDTGGLTVHAHTVTGTAAAQSISSTDTETTPAFLALNYIIKL